jgi:hypothetical protein
MMAHVGVWSVICCFLLVDADGAVVHKWADGLTLAGSINHQPPWL